MSDFCSVEAMILRHRMRWNGHVVGKSDSRIPMQLLYGKLKQVKHNQYKPKLRYKDCLKTSLAK